MRGGLRRVYKPCKNGGSRRIYLRPPKPPLLLPDVLPEPLLIPDGLLFMLDELLFMPAELLLDAPPNVALLFI